MDDKIHCPRCRKWHSVEWKFVKKKDKMQTKCKCIACGYKWAEWYGENGLRILEEEK